MVRIRSERRSSATLTLKAIIPTRKVVFVPSNAALHHILSRLSTENLCLGSGKVCWLTVGYVSHTREGRTGVASRPEWKNTAAAFVHPLQLHNFLLCLFVLLFPSLLSLSVSIFHNPPPLLFERKH